MRGFLENADHAPDLPGLKRQAHCWCCVALGLKGYHFLWSSASHIQLSKPTWAEMVTKSAGFLTDHYPHCIEAHWWDGWDQAVEQISPSGGSEVTSHFLKLCDMLKVAGWRGRKKAERWLNIGEESFQWENPSPNGGHKAKERFRLKRELSMIRIISVA